MIDIHVVRTQPDAVRKAIQDKHIGSVDLVDELLEIDASRRSLVTQLQHAQTRSNEASRTIGELMRSGDREAAQVVISETGTLKARVKELEEQVREVDARQLAALLELPNLPHHTVPVGRSPEDNVVVHEHGARRVFDFEPEAHWDLCERLNLIDFDRGARVAGAGFPFYRGKGARLQRALISYFLDLAVQEGYEELEPPLLINEDSARGTGQLPDKEDLMYEIARDGLFLAPTAEVPVTNLLRGEILSETELPAKFCAYTPCFRREAGSWGRDVRGLNRLHQFDKVELVQFVAPDMSYDALEMMREDAERPLKRLEIPYRRVLMCTGDMGFTQSKKYDLEVWSPGQARWLEVSSVSNFEDFQARRMNIRYRTGTHQKPVLVHTLNGSALALPRVVAALIEQYQEADGSITIPDALRPYTGFDRITP